MKTKKFERSIKLSWKLKRPKWIFYQSQGLECLENKVLRLKHKYSKLQGPDMKRSKTLGAKLRFFKTSRMKLNFL